MSTSYIVTYGPSVNMSGTYTCPASGGRSAVTASTVTFYLDPDAVAATSDLDEYVSKTESFEAAQEALTQAGYETELDLEHRFGAGEPE